MKIALVTGAYKGLGLAWCRQLAKAGFFVVLTARDEAKAKSAAETIPNHETCIFPAALDVSDESQLKSLAEQINLKYGKVDLIINNAGVNPKDFSDKKKMAQAFNLSELNADVLLDVFRINSIAPLLVVKHFRSLLMKSDKPTVINISSWLGSVSRLSFGGHYGYVGSKNLLNVLNKSMALEIAKENIICVNVNPGWVQTDMGGQKATFTPDESVQHIMNNVVARVSIQDTGKFLNYDGTEHPW